MAEAANSYLHRDRVRVCEKGNEKGIKLGNQPATDFQSYPAF